MTTLWSDLPNAVHIDQVIASFKSNPDQWKELHSTSRSRACATAWEVLHYVGQYTIRRSAVDSLANIMYKVKQEEVAMAVSSALICLLSYDDCSYMLDSDVEELKILAAFGDERAILLLPACIAFHSIKELEHVN